MKRILSLVLALVLLASAVCLTGCFNTELATENGGSGSGSGNGGGNGGKNDKAPSDLINKVGGASETFEGALSEEVYSSAEDAATAYIAEEVVGNGDAEILSTKEKGTLSALQAVDAGIPAEFVDNADEIKEIEVTYTVADASLDSGVSVMANRKTTVKVYVIKINFDWQYFTPRPVTGDTITKTYYDSVFNAENYKNCTMESTVKTYMSTKVSYMGETMDEVAENTVHQLIKYADGKIYMEQKVTSTSNTSGTTTNEIYFYLEETEDGETLCYVKTSADAMWSYGSLYSIGFTSVEQLTPFYNQYLDYTYFTKTDYGFALADDNARAYFTKAFSALAGSFASLTENMDFEMLAKYVVKNGALSAMINTAVVGMNYSEMGATVSMLVKADSEITCTNYGTTYIERPNVD